jgi:hypothetical protein
MTFKNIIQAPTHYTSLSDFKVFQSFIDTNKFITEVLYKSKNLRKEKLPHSHHGRRFLRLWQLLIGPRPEVAGIRSTSRDN